MQFLTNWSRTVFNNGIVEQGQLYIFWYWLTPLLFFIFKQEAEISSFH